MSGKKKKEARKTLQDPKRVKLSRLESMLRYYEAFCRWWYCLAQNEREYYHTADMPLSNGIVNYLAIRDYLLASRTGDVFDRDRFGVPRAGPLWGADFVTDPLAAIHGWCSSSRRVYRLDTDLQLLLAATGFGSVTWSDLALPFPSFAMLLDTSIKHKDQGYDCIMVSRQRHLGRDWLLIVAISEYIDEYVIGYDRLSRQLFDTSRSGNTLAYNQAIESHGDLLDRTREHNVRAWYVPADQPPDRTLDEVVARTIHGTIGFGYEPTDTDNDDLATSLHLLEMILRIVLGVPLYLASVPNSSAVTTDEPTSKSVPIAPSPVRAITDGAQICTVRSIHRITNEERVALTAQMNPKNGRKTVNPHFRAGHWRRPPGKGDDPTAKKTVWVRPTLVKVHELPDGAQPDGSMSKLG